MKTASDIMIRKNKLRKMIIASEYGSYNPVELNCEYNTLCWVLGVEPENLSRIKNDYLLATME